MTTSTHTVRTDPRNAVAARAAVEAIARRREYRERDFGVGYGNSSGYATARRYASQWAEPRFRCA